MLVQDPIPNSSPTVSKADPRAVRRARRNRTRSQPLGTSEEQLAWLVGWAGCDSAWEGPAQKTARRRVALLQFAVGEASVDGLVSVAVEQTFQRISRRISNRGPVEEGGKAGFRGYCQQVLNNEVKRQLGIKARREASGPLETLEPVTVDLGFGPTFQYGPATESPAELPSRRGPTKKRFAALDEVASHRVEIRVWAHKYHERRVAAFEDLTGVGSFVIDDGVEKFGLELRASTFRVHPHAWDVPASGGRRLRLENNSPTPVHVLIMVVGYTQTDGRLVPLSFPRRILDTARGIGFQPASETHGYEFAVTRDEYNVTQEERDLPAPRSRRNSLLVDSAAASKPHPTPRKVPARFDIEVCDAHGIDYEVVRISLLRHITMQSIVQQSRGQVPTTWLHPHRVGTVAASIAELCVPKDTVQAASLVCRLVEWGHRGCHLPHHAPDSHPGGHPLESQIEAVVLATADEFGLRGAPNTVNQARSRMRGRVVERISRAALDLHLEMFMSPIRF